jgi:outer membrane protein TolC
MTLWLLLLLAVPAEAITLEEARSRAQERSLEVALARWDVEAARGTATKWTGAALPSIAGFAGGSTGAGFTSFGFERPVAAQIGAGVTARVMLVDPSTWAAATAARETVAGREATVIWARLNARRRATELVARALVESRVAEALAGAATDAGEEAAVVRALVDAGLRPGADAQRVRAQELDFTARSREAEGRAISACAALQNLMGVAIDGQCEIADLPPDPAPETSDREHPALVAARAAVGAAEASRTGTIAAQLPTLAADGGATHYTVPGAGGFGWSAGLTVAIPLRPEGVGEIKEADASRGRAVEQLRGQRRALDAARVGAEAEWSAARAAVEARRGSLEAADAALTLVRQRYRAGLTSVTDLLDARAARTDSAVGLLRAEAGLWSALAAVEAARGVD